MGILRSVLLNASQSRWLATHLPNYPFARRAVRKFMPGESIDDALAECAVLQQKGIGTVITRLGENVTQPQEADDVTVHYADVLQRIQRQSLTTHVSVKLTQLGLDIEPARAVSAVQSLMRKAGSDPIWIDMESSAYTDATIKVFHDARATGENVGLCLQSYLRRTNADLAALLPRTTAIRLVKGAYREAPEIAFPKKSEVDANYLTCARAMLERVKTGVIGFVPAFATHDVVLIKKIVAAADQLGVARDRYEFQLLYGINTPEQLRLARQGHQVRVLISYGSAWFAWYMRRLAERPANVLFLLRSLGT
jgi:proline dehydrogenase